MKAKLVYIDLLVRVEVPDNATDEEIMIAASNKAEKQSNWSWFNENITDIKDDTECPAEEYDSEEYFSDRMLEQQELEDFARDTDQYNQEPDSFI